MGKGVLHIIQAPVMGDLERVNALIAESMASGNGYIDTVIGNIFAHRGKQIRPLLVLLTAAINGWICDRTRYGALLVEVAHNASLVHDDVVDEAFRRRGELSTNALWRSRTAVLTGDFILARALSTAAQNGIMDLLSLMIDSFEKLSAGELIQMEHSGKLDMNEELYFEIINKKSASLLGSCGAIGAKSVGADDAAVEEMRIFGEHLGMAFQIKDDVLDYLPSAETGKPSCQDLRERKITLPLLYLLDNSSPAERKELIRRISNMRYSDADVEYVRGKVLASGAIEYAFSIMQEFRDKALHLLAAYPESEVRSSLEFYCDFILDRNA